MMLNNKDLFFREAVVRICGDLQLDKALKSCLEYLAELIPVDLLLLAREHDDFGFDHIMHFATTTNYKLVDKYLPIPKHDHRIKIEGEKDLESISIVNNPATDPAILEYLQTKNISTDCSLMILKLSADGIDTTGKLVLKISGRHRYTVEHARLLILLKEPFTVALSNSLRHEEIKSLKEMLSDDCRFLKKQLNQHSAPEIIGADAGLIKVMKKVQQVAKTDSSVLLLGETGVGKEVIAKAIHYYSLRTNGPLVRVNCGSIPKELIASELFGHEKGAFTGALTTRRGKFERADKGTIFLDEIGELPAGEQIHLLHVLQNREVERVGGSNVVPIDVRMIFATHRDLKEMVDDGTFREDLFFRMNVFPIIIPPLRERLGDIPSLIHHFIKIKAVQLRLKEIPKLGTGALDSLKNYHWPGNIRELENIVERALIQYRGGYLDFTALLSQTSNGQQFELENNSVGTPVDGIVSLDEMLIKHISATLRIAKGKIAGTGGAAELLNLHPNTLRKKMDKLGIRYRRKDLDN